LILFRPTSMETPAYSPATATAPLSQASVGVRPLLRVKASRHAVSLLFLCLMFACSVLIHAAPAAEPLADEYQVKAAFLFNFAKFVEWPSEAFSDANAPLVITVFGDDPFSGSLEAVKGKLVNNRRLHHSTRQRHSRNRQEQRSLCRSIGKERAGAHPGGTTRPERVDCWRRRGFHPVRRHHQLCEGRQQSTL
jgi:YfiR/HmsC-like